MSVEMLVNPHPAAIVTETALLTLVHDARSRGEVIVMTNGCFDILHAGHVLYLQQAKTLGQRLIVAVNDDASLKRLKGPQRPINPLLSRMIVLAGLAAVDWVTSFSEDTPERLISTLLPDILVKGADYAGQTIPGGSAVVAHGGRVELLTFYAGHSTTRVINQINQATDK